MKNIQPSDTYKFLYNNIIEEYIFNICNEKPNYCIKNDEIAYDIYQKYEDYKNIALGKVASKRLDRHKLASCICGAIIEVKPVVSYNGAPIYKNVNEVLGLYTGLGIIKCFMMHNYVSKLDITDNQKANAYDYLRENLCLKFLEENICDTQNYQQNLINALGWSHFGCDILKRECFYYDIWAYSTIFYHLELYNQKQFKDNCEKYFSTQNISIKK